MYKIFQVDAFAEKVFSGNPAAVCPLDSWPDDGLLQKIAMENNLSETAFYVNTGDVYHIRWFTPSSEVELCGHATLAAAWVLFNQQGYQENMITFFSALSGKLTVRRSGHYLMLNFPSDIIGRIESDTLVAGCFNIEPVEVYRGRSDYLLVYKNESQVRELVPNTGKIKSLAARGIIVTAKGDKVDFVSRFFAPAVGIDEDPVTGSAHTSLIPFWSERFNKKELTARQLSKRGGHLKCRLLNDRVEISGKAVLYMKGKIFIH